MNRNHYSWRLNSHRGAALIIVLAFVVLLTGLAVAFFSRAATDRQVSYSSASQSNAELLARGALAITIGDLKQEVAAGSTVSTVSGVTIYSPKTSPSTVTPALVGSTATNGLENLVKRSANGVAFYPSSSSYDTATYPASNRAAAVSTTALSLNNRTVSTARWNKPLLLKKATIASGTDFTPVGGFTPPDWILIARNGSNPTTWNSNMITSVSNGTTVIGRYAYTIYDEGGLLDMNVAGNPTVSTAAQVGRKGNVAYADLTQVPGIASVAGITALTSGKQSKFVNNIVGWRNFASSAASGSLGTFSGAAAYSFASGTTYFNAIFANSNGFLRTSNTSLNGGQSDRMLSGRQELITLLLRGIASSGTDSTSASERANLQYALQYLGMFSRELNRPTWSPSTPTGSTINYAAQAETSTAIDRDLATVRVTGTFTRADGTQAVVGEPLLKERFSLARLNGLGSNGVVTTGNSTLVNGVLSPASAATVQRDFGLIWDSANNRWKYVGATGSTVQSSIERLDQVAGENREPNFFEILKAVILSGSVGLGSNGATNTFVINEAKYSSADHQIMQIGANIIDAWDSDNIPTFIYFNNNELAGVENLPYLNKLVLSFLFTNNGHGDLFYSWLVPSLWNPHQNAASAPATQDVRFAMTSGSTNALVQNKNSSLFVSPPIPNSAPYPYVEVKANAFLTPQPSVPSPAVSPAPTNENGSPPSAGQVSPTNQGQGYYDGLYYGSYTDTSGTGINSWKNADQVYPYFAPGTNFEMQVQINGQWKAYQTWKGCNNGAQGAPLVVSTGAKKNRWKSSIGFKDPEFVALDPRTVRLGVWASHANAAGNNDTDPDYDIGAEDTMDQYLTGLESISAMKPQPAATFPTTGNTYLYSSNATGGDKYSDLDGVNRRGDWTTDPNGTTTKTTIMYGSPQSAPPGGNYQDRPQILSAPFQSVAELGQVFRDQPWKTLAFTIANSGDAGLLDAFTLKDVPTIAGRTSLNTRQSAVLNAILSQAAKNLVATSIITSTQASAVATALTTITTANPMISKGELVTKLAADASVTGLGNKEARECVTRAFSDAGQTRTWNLMIDVIAQSGRYPPNATTLANFMVEGEKRYWLHVAIDRFTGEIIDQQLEAVYE